MIKIAGVTFNNEDGESRQEILKELYNSGRRIVTVDVKPTTFEGDRAIRLIEHHTKKMLGWVPKDEIKNIKHSQMTAFIDFSTKTGKYSARIDEQKKPTPKQYEYVKYLCTAYRRPMPAYDVRAYADVFALTRR